MLQPAHRKVIETLPIQCLPLPLPLQVATHAPQGVWNKTPYFLKQKYGVYACKSIGNECLRMFGISVYQFFLDTTLTAAFAAQASEYSLAAAVQKMRRLLINTYFSHWNIKPFWNYFVAMLHHNTSEAAGRRVQTTAMRRILPLIDIINPFILF